MCKWGHIFGDADGDGDVDFLDVLIAEEDTKKPTPITSFNDDDDDDNDDDDGDDDFF